MGVIKVILALVFVGRSGICSDSFNYSRLYRPGEVFGYHFRVDSYEDGRWIGGLTAVSRHQVTEDSAGGYSELVTWSALTVREGAGERQEDELARAVPAFRLTLADNGESEPPPVVQAPMSGVLNDFAMFYGVLEPKMGLTHLHQIDDHYENPDQGLALSLLDLNTGVAYVRVTRDYKRSSSDESGETLVVAQIDRQSGKINWASALDVSITALHERRRTLHFGP